MQENTNKEEKNTGKQNSGGIRMLNRMLTAVIGILVIVLLATAARRFGGEKSGTGATAADLPSAGEAASASVADASREAEEKQDIIASYGKLGIANVEGYLNIRKEPTENADIIGKLQGGAACTVTDDSTDGWYQISSNDITGYVNASYMLTGSEAAERAEEEIAERAVVTADAVNIRKEPSTDAEVVGQALKGERYLVKKPAEDGWIGIDGGYISADYAEVKPCLNEARKLDMKAMVLNLYDNLGVSKVDNYLNIRETPGNDTKIIGKLTSKCGCEIIEMTTDHEWYKIQSGPVTGYVKAEYILTGDAANQFALENAKLMAIVNTDRLNVRKEPNTDSQIWTQISNSERYDVVSQDVDGWVQIQLDDDTAYVMTDYVDVRYALNEAIQYTPPAPEPEPETQAPAVSGNGGNSSSGKSSTGKSSSGKNGSGKSSSGKSSSKNGSAPSGGSGGGKRSSVVSYAVQFLGNPYVWGGTSLTNGTDCSGFTMSVMSHFGVSLPHHAASQAGCGSSVSAGSMKPGDLVFYSNGSGINHVAIYIGNGQVVHASNPKSGIKISSWNYRTPAAIRNVLGN